ncbi:PREDICTED: wall-associated receptor kinase-like 9 [Camelina sativa]|uniref:Wall-associated receptor kinase-like 9 n=1 Tax=Camelina sativa TaxID=90675 RepID=A0ABM0VYH6_CAMSA|nr:PREDICTED: wall-associated receptor kinase-like 9 [Camelina sativa]
MKCVHWIRLCVLLLVLNTSSEELTISSSCPTHCGKVSIPYPFGIGKDCYLNPSYEVQCNQSTSVPYLPSIKKEVVQIDHPRPVNIYGSSFPHGTLRIKTEITSVGCSGANGQNLKELLNFTGTPFSISENNTLVSFGCNSKATLTNIDPRIVGCVSICDIDHDLILQIYSKTSCSGYRCCNASTPADVGRVIGVKIESNDGNETRQECSVAFLTDEYGQPSLWPNRTDAKKLHAGKYATIELKWQVITSNLSFEESLGCRQNRYDFYSNPCYCEWVASDKLLYVGCACMNGYEDVDECKQLKDDGRPGLCTKSGEICQNIPGAYRCVPKKSKTLAIYIGVSIGLTVLVVGVGIWLYIVIKKYRKTNRMKKFFKRNGGLLLQQQLASREGYVEKAIVFSSKELEKATENFSLDRVLGHGGQGTVFKGMLADGRIVAVKKSKVVDQDKLEEFINEVCLLSQINHRNIVNILGCCLETEVPLLVYEFIPNGNLFQLLHEEDDHALITWELRVRIAIDTAGALSYLHSAAASPIYHRDIKSANILLDENYRAKVSYFGTSRSISVDQTHLTTAVIGTPGYVDPEYYQSSQFTDKSDVYSFGVVLVELITGEKPVSFQRFGENRTLAAYFNLAVRENKVFDIIDSRIRNDCKLGQVMVIANLAKRCLNLSGRKRPTMTDVWLQLKSSRHGDLQTEVEVNTSDDDDDN